MLKLSLSLYVVIKRAGMPALYGELLSKTWV